MELTGGNQLDTQSIYFWPISSAKKRRNQSIEKLLCKTFKPKKAARKMLVSTLSTLFK
jgi:hypothetical protein